MDTLTFLRLLLPDEGIKFLIEIRKRENAKDLTIHEPYQDLEQLSAEAFRWSDAGKNVFFACSTYNEAVENRKPSRYEGGNDFVYYTRGGQANVMGAKSLWLDIDVGKDDKSKSYDTPKEALDAIKALCDSTGLPTPLLVSSGNGFHCYWRFDTMASRQEWELLASLWREVTKKAGIKIDPSRDMDSASILRIPGTINPKGGKTVRVLRDGSSKPYAFYMALFKDYLGEIAAPLINAAQYEQLGNNLEVPVNYPPSSLERIANHCQTIKWFKDTGAAGPGNEPAWRACIGVAKHCTDGEELAHKWSAQDDRYSEHETQEKLNLWIMGPSLCETMRDTCGTCKGCQLTVKTPVQLGYSEEVAPPQPIPPEQVARAIQDVIVPTIDPLNHWPRNVTVIANKMCMMIPDPESGAPTPVPFAFPKFWPEERVKLEDGTYAMRIKMEVKAGRYREFDLPVKHIVDGRSLRTALAANEVIVLNDKLAMSFLQSYSDKLRTHLEEVNTFNQYGWTNNFKGVLLGNQLLTEDGINTVRLAKRLQDDPTLASMFEVAGDAKTWIDGVDTLYNREHGEPYQYAIAAQFGAWLCPLMESEEWNGMPLALTSGPSGRGKSTVIKIGLNAFLRSNKTTVTGSTVLGITIRASTMGSVPVLFDEITGYLKTGDQLSDVLYTLSNGRQRVGGRADGTERTALPPFKLMSSITANRNTLFQLTESKVNPEATQMRIFEIDLEDYATLEAVAEGSPLHDEHSRIVDELLDRNYGTLAVPFLTYVMKHKDEIKALLEKTYRRVKTIIGETGGNAAKERFYARHIACVIVGLMIAVKLEMLRFSVPNLLQWSINHVKKMRQNAVECRSSTADKLSNMMSDFNGYLILTRNYETLDVRSGPTEEPMVPVRGSVKARVVLGSKSGNTPERGKIIIAVRAMDDWCRDNNINAVEFRKELVADGYIRSGAKSKPMYLAKGVPSLPIGQQRCIELDYGLMQGMISGLDTVAHITPQGNAAPDEAAVNA